MMRILVGVLTKSEKPTSVWGPVSLAFLVNSGQIKGSPLLSWVPVDLTVLLALIVGALTLTTRARLGPASGWLALPLTLWTIFLLPVAWTPFDSYTVEKLAILFTITALLAISPFQLLREERQRKVFLITTSGIALFFAATTLIFEPVYATEYSNRITLAGANTIGTARVAMAGALVMCLYALQNDLDIKLRIPLIVAALLTSTLGVMTGSRGPVLAALIAALAVVVSSPIFAKHRVRSTLGFITLGVVIVWLGLRSGSDGLDRILGGSETSNAAREALWQKAIKGIQENPLGVGWGMFSPPGLEHGYPHNLVLEVGVEAGWFPLVAFIVLLAATAIRGAYRATTSVSATLFGLYIFALINAFVSDDINGTRLLWVTMFALWAMPRSFTKASKDPSSPTRPFMTTI